MPGGVWAADACVSGEVEDNMASFSNHGVHVDVIAPGTCIRSAWLDGAYATTSGTSLAASHAAGAAALLAANTELTPGEIEATIKDKGNFEWGGDKGSGPKEPRVDVSDPIFDPDDGSGQEPGDAAPVVATRTHTCPGCQLRLCCLLVTLTGHAGKRSGCPIATCQRIASDSKRNASVHANTHNGPHQSVWPARVFLNAAQWASI